MSAEVRVWCMCEPTVHVVCDINSFENHYYVALSFSLHLLSAFLSLFMSCLCYGEGVWV